MGLREQQRLLAKLYTDVDFQETFFQNPAQTTRLFGLSEEEISQMRNLCPAQVRFFASTLELRRAAQAANLIPALSGALGRRYLRYFHDYVLWCARCPGNRLSPFATFYRRRREDALGLANFIAKRAKEMNLPPWIGELARYERICLTRDSMPFWICLSRFRYPVRQLAEAFESRRELPEMRPRSRLLLTLKLGGLWETSLWLPLPRTDRNSAPEVPQALGGLSRVEGR